MARRPARIQSGHARLYALQCGHWRRRWCRWTAPPRSGLEDDYFVSSLQGADHDVAAQFATRSHANAEDNQFGFAPAHRHQFSDVVRRARRCPASKCARPKASGSVRPTSPTPSVVNTGEMLGRYSNDRYTPTPHRVINDNNNTAARHSVLLWTRASRRLHRALPTCASADNPARYEPLLYADHRRKPESHEFRPSAKCGDHLHPQTGASTGMISVVRGKRTVVHLERDLRQTEPFQQAVATFSMHSSGRPITARVAFIHPA